MSAGLFTTCTPAAVSAAIFSAAVPLPPGDDRAGVAHAAPGRRGLAGDEADHRLLDVRLDPAAASSSALPPISPIITIASVSRVVAEQRSASMNVVPMSGSPPMPMHGRLARARAA